MGSQIIASAMSAIGTHSSGLRHVQLLQPVDVVLQLHMYPATQVISNNGAERPLVEHEGVWADCQQRLLKIQAGQYQAKYIGLVLANQQSLDLAHNLAANTSIQCAGKIIILWALNLSDAL